MSREFKPQLKKNLHPLHAVGPKLVAVSAATLAAAIVLAPKSAIAHPGLSAKDGRVVISEAMLGEPKGSDIALAVEALILEGELGDALAGDVSDSARAAARLAYAQGVFAPMWTRTAAEKLMAANPTCRENGFDSGMTDEQLRAAIDARFSGDARTRAQADLDLTATWLVLASKMSGGLSDEGGMVRSTTTKPTRSDLVQAIRSAAQSDPIAEMERFASLSPQYDMLKEALKQYRQHAQAGGWMKLRDGDDMLEPGMNDPRVPALRARLAAEGFVPPRRYASLDTTDTDQALTVYDETLASQLEAFQAAHGLAQDGVLGPATLAALNESAESKINRIERAMDYWRQNPNLGDQHIWVNVPSYRVEGWKDGVREISMKTIVGKKRTPTPSFSDEVEYIVVNPKWFLPIGLFKRQKLRKLKADPGYAEKYKYKIYDRSSGAELNPYDIDWNEPGVARRIQMVQTPGPHNALGQLKIIFPNRHAVYLHDTPDHHLFERDVRALSSGCIRLEDPVAMANWITDNDTAVATNVFNATLESRERERFYLDHHLNVHLTYLPAVVSPEGRVEFPADIYRKFKKPTLAKGTYPDNMGMEGDQPDMFVRNTGETGSRTINGKATLQ